MRIPRIFMATAALAEGRRAAPTLVLRRPGADGRRPAVWYIAYGGGLASTHCAAHERTAAEAVLNRYRDRLLADITGGGPIAKPRSTLDRLVRDHLARAKPGHHRRRR